MHLIPDRDGFREGAAGAALWLLVGMPDGHDGDGAQIGRQLQNGSRFGFVKTAAPAAAQTDGSRTQQNVFDRRCGVLDHIQFPASLRITIRVQSRIGAYDENDRRRRNPGLIGRLNGNCRLQFLITQDHKMPRLPISGARRGDGGLQQQVQLLVGNVFSGEGANALALFGEFEKVHA